VAHIVVIECDLDQGEFLAPLLSDQGWDVVTCWDIAEAYMALRGGKYEVIIVDVPSKGDTTTWDLLTVLQLDIELNTTPVIVCSPASDELLVREEWLGDHNIVVLSKPFDLEHLQRTVDQVIHR
jgi:DNA-binding response OmpR family regulator